MIELMVKTRDEKTRRKILTGNLWKVILSITIPLFLYQLVNSFYNLLDQVMVASIGDNSVSAVATISQIKQLISAMGMGLAGGGAIIVSRLYGAGKIKEARKNANVTFTMGLIVCALVLLICLPCSTLILQFSQVPDDLIAISQGYFMLQLVEQALMVINNIFIGIEKSKGNTRVIFICNVVSMIIKISFNSLFIYGLKLTDLIWVEIASLLAQGTMFSIGLYYLFRKKNIFKIAFNELSLKWIYVKKILVISFPLFLGKFVISLGKVGVNAMCKMYGSLTVGALGISNNIGGIITNAGASFEDSESSIVSQNLGNKNMRRTIKTFLVSLVYITIWTVLGYLCVRVFFEDNIINLFSTENTSSEFTTMIKNIFYYDSLSIPSLAINSVILGILYGYGQTFLATINNLLRIGTRIFTLWFLQTYHPEIGSEAAGISMGISNIAIAIFAIIIFIFFIIKIKVKGFKGMHLTDPEPQMIEENGILVRRDSVNETNNKPQQLK